MIRTPTVKLRSFIKQAFGLLVLFLSGCAAVPDNWAFNEEVIDYIGLQELSRIALLDVPTPSNIVLGDQFSDTAWFLFGTVGGLAVENTEGNKIVTGKLFSEVTQNSLEEHLEWLDFEVILIRADRKEPSKMLTSYDQFAQIDADAILEVAPVEVGFKYKWGEFGLIESNREVSPEILLKYRLISVKSGEILYQSNVQWTAFDYKGKPPFAGYRIESMRSLIFENTQAVKDNPEEAIQRLKRAINEVTLSIARNILK